MSHLFTEFSLRRIGRWTLMLTALWLVGWLIWAARSALLPFAIGVVLAYLFLPIVNRFERGMPRWAAILMVYFIVLGLTVAFSAFLVPPLVDQVSQLISAIPDLPTMQNWAEQVLAEYEQLLANLPTQMSEQIRDTISELFTQAANTLRTNFVSYVQGVGTFLIDSLLSIANTVSFLLGFFLIPFWLFYVLMDQRAGRASFDQLLPPSLRSDVWTVVAIVDHDFSGYLRGQLILGLAVGSAAGVGLSILNLFGMEIPYVLLLSVIAGITELIPIIGPILGSIPAIILGFMHSPTTGIAVLILYIIIQQVENSLLVPRIVGESVGLHPAILMILLVVCSQVFGIMGAILSAPVGAVARDVFNYLYGRLSDPPQPAGLLPERLRLAGMPPPVPVAMAEEAATPPEEAAAPSEEPAAPVVEAASETPPADSQQAAE